MFHAYLMGESLGGLIGLRLLHDFPRLFSAAVFSSPGIEFQTNGVSREALRAQVVSACENGECLGYAPGQGGWTFDPDGGGRSDPTKDDPEHARSVEGLLLTHPELREDGATNGFVMTLLEEADTEQSLAWPEAIATPVVFGYTPNDRIARPDVIQSVCLRMPHCTVAKFVTTGHALFNDAETTRKEWMRQAELFLGPPAVGKGGAAMSKPQ